MKRESLKFDELSVRALHLWEEHWLALTSGDLAAGKYNSMAVGWGSLGTMWQRPFAQVVVRPTRYTYEFMQRYDTFTLCAFPEKLRSAVQILGSTTGRAGNKIAEAGLTPAASTKVAAPCFAEAELVIECRKIYWDDLKPANFLDQSVNKLYPAKDFHRVYFGEVLAVSATAEYRSR